MKDGNSQAKPKFAGDNFQRALSRLESFIREPVEDDRDVAGIIQAFEFTFELCWKLFRVIAEYQGLEARSPRQAIKVAFQLGLVVESEEKDWLAMLDDRNLTVHTYRQETAQAIFGRIKDRYLACFQAAGSRAQEWL